jgi:hypothetical protein
MADPWTTGYGNASMSLTTIVVGEAILQHSEANGSFRQTSHREKGPTRPPVLLPCAPLARIERVSSHADELSGLSFLAPMWGSRRAMWRAGGTVGLLFAAGHRSRCHCCSRRSAARSIHPPRSPQNPSRIQSRRSEARAQTRRKKSPTYPLALPKKTRAVARVRVE